MNYLRVSASDIDTFRYFLATEDQDLDDLIAQLRRKWTPTVPVLAGRAFHIALENAKEGDYEFLEADGYNFDLSGLEGEIDLPDIREVKATKDYQVNDVTVTLVGKVDAIHGRRVDDHKFTSRYDAERFLNSYQWRIYLDVFDADEFRWNVFEGKQAHKDDDKVYDVRALHRLTMHRYPGMDHDVREALVAFTDFARRHLPEKITRSAA